MLKSALFSIFIFTFTFMPATPAFSASGAAAHIESLHGRVARELVGNITPDVRRARFRGLLRDAFDLDKISRFVLGPHWAKASAQQQQNFKRVFEDYLVASYADSFKSYGGDDFKIARVDNSGPGTALVTTLVKIQKKDGSKAPAEIEWRLKGMKIVDVSVENVSMSITKRNEFSSILQSNGNKIDGLIQQLQKRA
jgi:phospholipid transport system substrate-binding protein